MNEQIQEIRYQVGEAWKGTYNQSTTYGNAAVVQDATGLSVYRSLKSGNVGHPLTDTAWWFCIIDLSSIKAESERLQQIDTQVENNEATRISNEEGRVSAEQARVNAEQNRIYNEQQRENAETARIRAEQDRVTQENQRIGNEQGRVGAEQRRVAAEQSRVNAESIREAKEEQRQLNENNRVAAEAERVAQAASDHAQAVSDHDQYVLDNAQLTDLVNRADADHTQAESDHTRAGEDHTTAGTDHTTAGSDHTRAGEDHTQAGNDHTQAGSDHTRAGEDHTTAAADHVQAGEDHAQYLVDHASIASKANVAANPTAGNLAGLDAGGNPTDSGIAADEVFIKGTYSADSAVGLADNIRGDVYADEQFAVRMTGGEANEVGGIGVVQVLKGAGAAISQLFPEGSGHDFSGDVSLDGTSGNAEAVVRYSDAGTVEMGYLLAMEAFISQTLTQAQLDAISAKDTGKADRDKAVWLTPAGAITSAPTIESGQTEVTFSGWRIAMRVKASEVRDAAASSYWFTSGTAGRQVYDVAVAEGIDAAAWNGPFYLANGWNTGSAMEYLQHMAAQGLPTHSVKAMSALLAVTKIGIKTVKSRNLLNPQTGRALLKAYVNDDETYLDNEYTMLGGLPSGATMAFTSLLTGKTETLQMLDSTHFVIPSDGWLQITGTMPESIIATWNGEKDNTAADEYATESHVWDVTQLFGTKDGGTEGHYYRFAKEGMRGCPRSMTLQDTISLVNATADIEVGDIDLTNVTWNTGYAGNNHIFSTDNAISDMINTGYPNRTRNLLSQEYLRIAIYFPGGDGTIGAEYQIVRFQDSRYLSSDLVSGKAPWLSGQHLWYQLNSPKHFTSLFLSASSTADELTAMPADAIPLSEIQFADNNWSIEEAVYDAPEADANGVITPTAVTGQMRIQYSLDAAEQIDTLQKEYAALEARVTALEGA